MNSGSEITQSARQWYIQVDGQAYGPFDDRTLWSYMIEGRVSAQSLISQSADTSYRPVSTDPALMSWLEQAAGGKTVGTAAADTQAKQQAQTEPLSVFMIMAEIRSERGMSFLQSLQSLGTTQRIGGSVWILQAQTKAKALCNILSQGLDADDRLFVLDSFANETAWFNLSPEMDSQIAELWKIER